MARRTASGAQSLVSCPGCGAKYKIPAKTRGRVRCKNCGTAFSTALAHKGKADNQTAIRATVISVVALILVGALMYAGSNTQVPGGGAKKKRKKEPAPTFVDDGGPSTRIEDEPAIYSDQPEKVSLAFLKAMGEEDPDQVGTLFGIARYYEWAAEKHGWSDEQQFVNKSEEEQQDMRDEQVDALMLPDLCGWIKRRLVPSLEAGEKTMIQTATVAEDNAAFRYLIKDQNDRDIVAMRLIINLKKGLSPEVDGARFDAWEVTNLQTQWLIASSDGNTKRERTMVDRGVGTRKAQERRERKKAGGGDPEVDPYEVAPLAGTGPTQTSTIKGAIATMLDPGQTTGALRARDQLRALGKVAIPFLLNQLEGRDHRSGERDIFESLQVCMVLREITGKSFGYGPQTAEARAMGGGLAAATPEQRIRAVRRWFAWWKFNGARFTERPPEPDEDDEDDEDL